MKAIPVLLISTALVSLVFAAERPRTRQAVAAEPSANKLFIFSLDGATMSPTNVVWRKNVQVFETDLYLECELLMMTLQTNRPSSQASRPASGSLTNFNADADTIIAETNVLMMSRGTSVMGDRAVYTKSTETVVVTGELVAIMRSNLLFFATNFVFNVTNSSGYAVGWTATEVDIGDRMKGTNSPKIGIGPGQRTNPPKTTNQP